MPSRDLGGERAAQRERTDLAWQRSAFSFLALAGVVLGIAAHHDAPALLVAGLALIAVAGAIWRQGRTAYQRADVSAQPRVLALLSTVTAVAALVAAAVVLVRL
jgi:uncharacterized membrane protein YidH (DUF202 family)